MSTSTTTTTAGPEATLFAPAPGCAHHDPTRSTSVRHVDVEYTSRCNLRCTYCSVSQPGYDGSDLDDVRARALIDDLMAFGAPNVAVNGHGETTMIKGWHRFADELLSRGLRLQITTNFARALSDEELAVFARFAEIRISLDTVDDDLLRRVRRKVGLGTVVANLMKVRAAALAQGAPGPDFTFSCGVYDRNVTKLPDLARFAVVGGIRRVCFWNYIKFEDVEDGLNVYPLSHLAPTELREAVAAIHAAAEILHAGGVEIEFAGDFVEVLAARVEATCTGDAR